MMCDECKQRPASVHWTSVVNGQSTSLHLCAQCAAKHEAEAPGSLHSPLFVNDLINSFLGGMSPAISRSPSQAPLRCSKCGMTLERFRQNSLLGCSHCYQDLKPALEPILRQVQSGAAHTGKVPSHADESVHKRKQREQLQQQLQQAIAEENFEQAALLRDQIRALEEPDQEGGDPT